jgi:hypothetical protein
MGEQAEREATERVTVDFGVVVISISEIERANCNPFLHIMSN